MQDNGPDRPKRFALIGNPNTGKTTLFNALCGERAETANFPGSTVSTRRGTTRGPAPVIEIIDLPGHYGLNLDRPESQVSRAYLAGEREEVERPEGVIVIVDATNLPRNLMLVSQAVQQGLPAVVALNMMDVARKRGLSIDVDTLAERVGCPVVPVSARAGEGIDDLREALESPEQSTASLPSPSDATEAGAWADEVVARVVSHEQSGRPASDALADRLDGTFMHPVGGLLVFAAVMAGLFYTIFSLSSVPMDLIEGLFAEVGTRVGTWLPDGAIRDLLVDGVIAGIAGTLVFLPQICLLFFLISLLEGTGYLARAAFVMDRLLHRFGLPGQSFVPLLSAHACAIPAIMSARLVPDRRDRIATILVAPFMSCSARLPVYVLLIGFLFEDALIAGLAFAGCYALGAIAAVVSALIARRTMLPGKSKPMVLELPPYRIPSLRTAILTTWDRARSFLVKAGTVIVAISIVLWWLGAYPAVDPPEEAVALRAEAVQVADADADAAAVLETRADALEASHASANSFIGRLGRGVAPVFEPIGADWQTTIGILSSFVAREVFVTTMTVVLAGTEDDPLEDDGLRDRIRTATRADGTVLFTTASTASLLVFYVLAMQCLPTLPVTAREAGGWRWALLQLGWMSVLAYAAAFITFRIVTAFT